MLITKVHLISFLLALVIEFLGWLVLILAVKPRGFKLKEIRESEWAALGFAVMTGILAWINSVIIASKM